MTSSRQENLSRILIVEDDGATRTALSRIFRRRGWIVDAAHNLAMARELMVALPDVILLDLSLPDGSGDSLLPIIQTTSPESQVIVITARSDIEDLDPFWTTPPNTILQKPVNLEQIDRAIGE